MGEVRVQITVTNPRTGTRWEELTALADPGATLTAVAGPVLRQLGTQRLCSVSLVLADGRRIHRDVGEALIGLDGDAVPARIVFGEPADPVLLGLTVLEQLGLAVDPVQRRLVRTDYLPY